MYVKCERCGGIIDPDTLICLMCARELSAPKHKTVMVDFATYKRITELAKNGRNTRAGILRKIVNGP